jgi:transposase InsO family protein
MVAPLFTGPTRTRHAQSWRTFLKNHTQELVAVDFLTQHTAGFRTFYIFVIMHVETRKVLRATVTAHPSLFWVKNQLRDLLAFDHPYRFLIHDNDGIFGQFGARHRKLFRVRCHLDRWLQVMGVRGIPTPYHAPNANAFVERFNRVLREECLNHFIFFSEGHLQRVVDEYVDFYNHARPSQGIGRIPHQREGPANSNFGPTPPDKIAVRPILGGIHHDYHRAA